MRHHEGRLWMVGRISRCPRWPHQSDVVVTATSPNLQGERIVVTDIQGQYRIPELPPGVYTLRFEKESFKPFSRTEIQLRLDRTIRQNVELLPESFSEPIEVMGKPPTIDVGSMNKGVNVDQDFIKRIAEPHRHAPGDGQGREAAAGVRPPGRGPLPAGGLREPDAHQGAVRR